MLYESAIIPRIISNILKRKFSKPPTRTIPAPGELVCMYFKWAAPHENPNSFAVLPTPGRGGETPYNGLYGEAPPERGTFFGLQVYKRVGI